MTPTPTPASPAPDGPGFDRTRLTALIARERDAYAQRHPASRKAFADGAASLLGGVPMTWMRMWPGGFPLYYREAHGARLTDLDGNTLTDFCLGDTGAMAGHSPAATVAAITRRITDDGGLTTMLPTEDAAWVAAELTRRFGASRWSFTLTATDANRWAIRLARQLTGRPKIAVFAYCYHGSVDETFIVDDPRRAEVRAPATSAPRSTRSPPPASPSSTTWPAWSASSRTATWPPC